MGCLCVGGFGYGIGWDVFASVGHVVLCIEVDYVVENHLVVMFCS